MKCRDPLPHEGLMASPRKSAVNTFGTMVRYQGLENLIIIKRSFGLFFAVHDTCGMGGDVPGC